MVPVGVHRITASALEDAADTGLAEDIWFNYHVSGGLEVKVNLDLPP